MKDLAGRYDCLIPETVYRGTVAKGKKKLCKDVFEIEEIVEKSFGRKKAKKSDKD